MPEGTWLDSRAKLTLNPTLTENQYGVAIAIPGGGWHHADWGLTLPMAVRFLKILQRAPSHQGYLQEINQLHPPPGGEPQ